MHHRTAPRQQQPQTAALHQAPAQQPHSAPWRWRVRHRCNCTAAGTPHGGADSPRQPHSAQQRQQRQQRKRPTQQAAAASSSDTKSLAYLGDAIWSLYVRRHFFVPPKHWRGYQAAVLPHISAEGQAAAFDALMQSSAGADPDSSSSSRSSCSSSCSSEGRAFMTAVADEAQRWRLRRRFDSAAAVQVYSKATALEALVGHLHLHDPGRIQQLVDAVLPPALPMPGGSTMVSSCEEESSDEGSSSSSSSSSRSV